MVATNSFSEFKARALELSERDHSVAGLMQVAAPQVIAMHVYQLLLVRDDRNVEPVIGSILALM